MELTLFEEIDIITEIQYPDYIYSTDSSEEKMAFGKYIGSLPGRRALLLNNSIFDLPFAVANLKENHIETILKEGGQNMKKILFSNLSDPIFLNQVSDFAAELDRRDKTAENSTRLKNVLQYLKDNKYII